MVCSLDFTSLYGGIALGGALATAAWAAWVVLYQPVHLRPVSAVIAPAAALTGSARACAGLLKQARLSMEAGHDATEILERAIDLVRARRMFIIAITMILWTAAMLAVLQFIGGNAKCLRRIVDTSPVSFVDFAGQPPRSHVVRGAAVLLGARLRAERVGFATVPVPAYQPSTAHARLVPQANMEAVHGPA